jgi:hypothetical protein
MAESVGGHVAGILFVLAPKLRLLLRRPIKFGATKGKPRASAA